MIITIVICAVIFVAIFQLGVYAHHRHAIDYKRRWLEATELLGGTATKLQPPDEKPWRLKITSGTGYSINDEGIRRSGDSVFFNAIRGGEMIRLDAMWISPSKRGSKTKDIPTPVLINKKRKVCMTIIDEMNEDERVHNG